MWRGLADGEQNKNIFYLKNCDLLNVFPMTSEMINNIIELNKKGTSIF